ncbi:MAG: hypothetical protein IKW33_04560 [Clostridia bacterium]|nr:hypothetical protein [Clostridia bacterium]
MIDKKYSIGLDLGTSSVKAVLFDGKKVVESLSAPFSFRESKLEDGAQYIGFSVDEYAEIVFKVISNLAKVVNGKVSGIAMASASGNTVICDKNYNAVIDAYSWTNSAFKEESLKVYGEIDREYAANVSGWGYAGALPLSHLAHVKIHSPNVIENCAKICMSTEYLLYKMTGKWGIDRSTAVPFFLLEQTTAKWHKPYLKALNISEDLLPNVYESGDFLGNITKEFSCKYGIDENCKVYLGSFDHPSGAIANGVVNEGELLLSCGTSWVLFFPYHDREVLIKNRILCDTFLSKEKGLWGGMCSVPQVSKKIDKIIESNISKTDAIKLFNEYSKKANKGADGLRINPTTDMDLDFSAYSKENIARALMEGAAYLLKDKLDFLSSLGIEFNSVKMAGGPSQSEIWVDIIRYIINKPVEVVYGVDSGAVGAAKRAFN